MQCQIFRTCSGSFIVVAEKSKIPASAGPCALVRTLGVSAEGGPMLGSESAMIIDHIEKFGFFHVPKER